MTTNKKIEANRANSKKSSGPITPAGKKYSSQNAATHGFFTRNPRLSDVEKEEFENLVAKLEKDLSPKTTLQHLAVRDIAWCMRRCGIALMLEARGVEAVLEQTAEAESGVSASPAQPSAFYSSSPQDLRSAISSLKSICEDFQRNHVMRDEWKPIFDTLFGPRFSEALNEWNSVSYDDILLAVMMNAKCRSHNLRLPAALEEAMKTPDVVIDPLQNEHLKEKLLEFQLRHLQEFGTWQQRAEPANSRIIEFSPRFYTTATRDLHRAVEWYWRLKELEGAA
jgi:hypothetical protein